MNTSCRLSLNRKYHIRKCIDYLKISLKGAPKLSTDIFINRSLMECKVCKQICTKFAQQHFCCSSFVPQSSTKLYERGYDILTSEMPTQHSCHVRSRR